MNRKDIAHLWANQSRPRGKASALYFEGDTIYSYGPHFPIARHYKGCVLFTERDYSKTTAVHKGTVRFACHHLPTFIVDNPANDPGRKDVLRYGERIKDAALSAARASTRANSKLEWLEQLIAEGNQFCERFGFKTRFAVPNLEQLKAKAAESAAKERKRTELRRKQFEAKCAETVAKWLAGESVTIPRELGRIYLRQTMREDWPSGPSMMMETSWGAFVPIEEAHKAYRFVMIHREQGWHRNGEQFAIGDYHLDAVNTQGVVAGCHRIGWDEIERFAAAQGWSQ